MLQSSSKISYTQSCETLDLQKSEALKPFSFFPNPANDKLNINVANDWTGGVLTLYTSMGQQVLDTNILAVKTQLDISQLQAGFYFYSYSKDTHRHSGKFVKSTEK